MLVDCAFMLTPLPPLAGMLFQASVLLLPPLLEGGVALTTVLEGGVVLMAVAATTLVLCGLSSSLMVFIVFAAPFSKLFSGCLSRFPLECTSS